MQHMPDIEAIEYLENDGVLPVQWRERFKAVKEGEFALWFMVLDDAISHCLFDRDRRSSTRQWIASPAYEIGSFRWICDVLELPTEILRRRLLELSEKPPGVHRRRGNERLRPEALRARHVAMTEGRKISMRY